MSAFRSLILKFFGPPPPARRSILTPIHKSPTLTGLTADDVFDAISTAETGDTTRLMALYEQIIVENSHLQSEFGKRKLAVLGDKISVMPATKDPADAAAAKFVETWIDQNEDWLDALIALLDSTIYPVAVVQKWFTPGTNGRRYDLRMKRVDPELFDFSKGDFRIYDTEGGHRQGTSCEINRTDYVVHRGHLLTSPDSYGGPLRSLLGWHLIANASPQWWGRFLERLGAPFLVGHVGSGDDTERDKVEAAFSAAQRLFGLVVSEGTRIEMIQSQAGQSGAAHQSILEAANREISKLIIGQTSSADVQSTGSLGSSSAAHQQVRSDYRDWDDRRLCDTITRQIVIPLLQVNGVPGRPPTIAHGVADVEQAELSAALIQTLPTAGLRLTDAGVTAFSERIGLPLERDPRAVAPEIRAPFSAERDFTLRRPELIQSAQARLLAATAPRLGRQISAVTIPDEILGTGAELLIEFLETSALQGK